MVDFTRSHFGQAKMFAELLADKSFTDAIIATAIEPSLQIHCHRVIMSAFSAPLKVKFLESPDPKKTVVVGQMKYNNLMAIVKLIYEGQVRVKTEEKEDFLMAMRMLYVQTGDDRIDQMVYFGHRLNGAGATSNATRGSLVKGIVSVASGMKQERDEMAVVESEDQSSFGFDSKQGHHAVKTSEVASKSGWPHSAPSFAASTSRYESTSSSLTRPLTTTTFGNSPFGSRKGSPITAPPPAATGEFVISVNRNSGAREVVGGAAATSRRRPFPAGGSSNGFSGVKRPRPPSPKPGFSGLYWLRLKNQMATTEHAVVDKYGLYDLHFVDGLFDQGKFLYLGFNNKQGAQRALQDIGRAEPDTFLMPVEVVPPAVRMKLERQLDKPQSRMQEHQQQESLWPTVVTRGPQYRRDSTSMQQGSTSYNNRPQQQQNGGAEWQQNIAGKLCLSHLPNNYTRAQCLKLLKMNGFSKFVESTIETRPGEFFIEFSDARELEEVAAHFHGTTIMGCQISATALTT